MKLYSSKRGTIVELMMNPIFHTILALAVVGLITFSSLARMTDKNDFERDFLSKDLALNINTIYAISGLVFLNYTQDMDNLTVFFNKDAVTINEKNKQDITSYFIGSKELDFATAKIAESPFAAIFLKQRNKIVVGTKDIYFNPQTAVCPNLDVSQKITDKSFILIPDESTKNIAYSLKNELNPTHPSFNIFGETFNQDLDISIELNKSAKQNEISIYYSAGSQYNKLFACLVFNSIISRYKFTKADLIAAENNFFRSDARDISISIVLPDSYPENIAGTINEGIRSYFNG